MNRKAESNIRRKLKVLEYAEILGNVTFACRKFGVSRDSFYRWKKQREAGGAEALANAKPCPEKPSIRVAKAPCVRLVVRAVEANSNTLQGADRG